MNHSFNKDKSSEEEEDGNDDDNNNDVNFADILTISHSSNPPQARTEFIASILTFANNPQTTYYPQVLCLPISLALRTKTIYSIIFIVNMMLLLMGLNSFLVKDVRKEKLNPSILYSSSSELMFRTFLYKNAVKTHIKTPHSAKAEERTEKKSHYRHECPICHDKSSHLFSCKDSLRRRRWKYILKSMERLYSKDLFRLPSTSMKKNQFLL